MRPLNIGWKEEKKTLKKSKFQKVEQIKEQKVTALIIFLTDSRLVALFETIN